MSEFNAFRDDDAQTITVRRRCGDDGCGGTGVEFQVAVLVGGRPAWVTADGWEQETGRWWVNRVVPCAGCGDPVLRRRVDEARIGVEEAALLVDEIRVAEVRRERFRPKD